MLQGKAQPKLLQTYAAERRKVAFMLINADREMSALVATRANKDATAAKTSTAEIEKFIARQNGFIAGTSIGYDESWLCTGTSTRRWRAASRSASASIRPGRARGGWLPGASGAPEQGRWPLARVHLRRRAPARWSRPPKPRLVDFLAHDASSPVRQYTPAADVDAVIDVYAVFQQQDLSIENLPDFLWPAKGRFGLRDYEKVFQTSAAHDVFAQRGIDRDKGCMVVVARTSTSPPSCRWMRTPN